jgi:YVTN family beta-propeller protein
MRWKILSLTLLATLVGVTWGTFVYPKLPIASVQAQSISTSGKARIGVAPRIISYQGYLKDSSSGQPVSNGNRTAVFSLYTSDSGGSRVWQETKTIVTRNGVFRTILGQTYPINPSIVSVPELWLGVRLPPDAEMTPRQRITGSVYSVGATEAQVSGTVAISPDNIAAKRWYKVDKARGTRIDVNFARMSSGDVNNSTYFTPCNGKMGFASAAASTTPNVLDSSGLQACDELTALGIAPMPVSSADGSIGHNLLASIGGGIAWVGGHHYSTFSKYYGVSGACWSITVVGATSACSQDNQIILVTPTKDPKTLTASGSATGLTQGFESFSCDNCRNVAYDGTNLWASSYATGKVIKFDLTRQYDTSDDYNYYGNAYPSSKTPTSTGISVGVNPTDIEFDGSDVWVAVSGEDVVKVIDGGNDSVVSSISVGSQPSQVLYDGNNIWVLSETDETITKIDAASKAVIGTYQVGSGPKDIGFDGSTIWVINADDSSITLLRSSDGALIETMALQGSPHYLQFDGQWMWVATKENPLNIVNGDGDSVNCGFNNANCGNKRWFLTRY